ncbi:MAG: DUF2793 domain-containing protein [Sphingomonas sp.]|uniref:DUF2793 domain-containing protein n=1 Tax=Sphingomonas sp. TaxID=28214 RepID=UPI0017BFDEA4|nr:DUF2793 domain-containing protein [Sphingomonas sp.]MBA3668357.1 DUF2793 domain-containing protein [Sphingomonas sp.]
MEQTPRFALPFLAPGQAQKEWFHNEALQLADMLLCPVVETLPSTAPPASPVVGQCFVVSTGATGAWAGHDDEFAGYSEGGWRFVPPSAGLSVLIKTSGERLSWRGGFWEIGVARLREVRVNGVSVVRDRQEAIAAPAGGSTVDAEGRLAIGNILAALRAHGLVAA